MKAKDFAEILAPFVTTGALIGLIISLFYLQNQNRSERIVSDERWSRLLESFTDFKNVTVSKFADIDKQLANKQDKN